MGTKLYVGNLSFNTTETDLQDLFAQAGAVQEVTLTVSETPSTIDEPVLEIDGRISDAETAQAELALMRQRPELQNILQRRTGQFMNNGTQRHSNALGLAQLLISYPVISAKLAQGDTI